MSTAERVAIPVPATGLMVFDNTTNSFWFRRSTGWEQIMDFVNSQWDEIGGVLIPKDGMRVTISPGAAMGFGRLNVVAESAASNSENPVLQLIRSTTGMAAPGLAGSLDFMVEQSNGAFSSSAKIVCEAVNTTPGSHASSLEFFTTGSGASNSQLYIGPVNVGIGTSTPSIFSKLDVNGTINTLGKVTRSSITGTNNLVPLCYGAVAEDGTVTTSTGNFSVLRTNVGTYLISNPNLDANCIVIVTPRTSSNGVYSARTFMSSFLTGDVVLLAFNASTGLTADSAFHIMIYKP